jgi:hypothetical protein
VVPKYFFHISDGVDKPDLTGTELPDITAAKVAAVEHAGEVIRDLGPAFWTSEDWQLLVTEADGRPVLTLSFSGSMAEATETPATHSRYPP